MLLSGQFPGSLPCFGVNIMDTSVIPVDVSAVYDVLLTCLLFYAGVWGITKVIQMFKRR